MLDLPGVSNDIQRGLQINDLGQVEFEAIFTDGSSGIFVSSALFRHPGDFNHDGAVDVNDLASWESGFGVIDIATHLQGDADGDRDVDGGDFLIWQKQLGSSSVTSPSAAAPEPTSAVLIAAAAGSCLWRRSNGPKSHDSPVVRRVNRRPL